MESNTQNDLDKSINTAIINLFEHDPNIKDSLLKKFSVDIDKYANVYLSYSDLIDNTNIKINESKYKEKMNEYIEICKNILNQLASLSNYVLNFDINNSKYINKKYRGLCNINIDVVSDYGTKFKNRLLPEHVTLKLLNNSDIEKFDKIKFNDNGLIKYIMQCFVKKLSMIYNIYKHILKTNISIIFKNFKYKSKDFKKIVDSMNDIINQMIDSLTNVDASKFNNEDIDMPIDNLITLFQISVTELLNSLKPYFVFMSHNIVILNLITFIYFEYKKNIDISFNISLLPKVIYIYDNDDDYMTYLEFLNFIHTIVANLIKIDDKLPLNNLNDLLPKLNLTKSRWPYYSYVSGDLISNILANINDIFIDLNKHGGLRGGELYSLDKLNLILEIASSIAHNIHNRAIYRDVTQNLNNCPLILTINGLNPPNEIFMYKYLYNPNLCSLFNKTTLTNSEYVINNISILRLFIIDPLINKQFDANKNRINLNKSYKKLSPYYTSLLANTNALVPELRHDYPHAIYQHVYTSNNTNIIDNQYNAYAHSFQNFVCGKHNIGIAEDLLTFKSLNNNTISMKRRELGIPDGYNINDDIRNYEDEVHNFNIENLPTSSISYKSMYLPGEHYVIISDDMFTLIPYSIVLSQHLFSPRKDVYNATLIQDNLIASPTILENSTNFLDFSLHIRKLHALDNYNSYIGEQPSYGKDLSNYKNFSINPIHTFIENLLKNNIDNVFNPNKAIKFNNFGFDIGSTSLLGKGLLGGYNISETFSDRFVNIHTLITGNNEMEILGAAYNLDDNSTTERSMTDGKLLYSYIFKSNFGDSLIDSSKKMFTLILNYFHKYNISFNSMFNQLCYPSILFNAAALRLSIERLSKIASKLEDYMPENSNTYKSSNFRMIKLFISNYFNNNILVLDKCEDYRYQIKFTSAFRDPNMTMQKIIESLNANSTTLPGFDNNKLLWLCNQYSCPSVANNFLIEFVKYITINTTNDPENNKVKNIQELFASGIPIVFRHIDSITSFINILFMFLKQTSYYSHEYDREISFFNVSNPEPFAVT